jgi:hypothetical protein
MLPVRVRAEIDVGDVEQPDLTQACLEREEREGEGGAGELHGGRGEG